MWCRLCKSEDEQKDERELKVSWEDDRHRFWQISNENGIGKGEPLTTSRSLCGERWEWKGIGGLACKVGREVNTLGCGNKEVLEMGTRIGLWDIHESIMPEKAMEVVKGRNEKMEDKLNKINMIGDKNGLGGRI